MWADEKRRSFRRKGVQKNGIPIRIRPTVKHGITRFVLDYRIKGQRKLVWRSTLADAKEAAGAAIDKMVAGHSEVLHLTAGDAHIYLRARDIVARQMAEAAATQ